MGSMTPDLLSLVLPLRLEAAPQGQDLPRWWGRAAHALLLKAVGEQDPALAQRLHDAEGPRPFTASTLIGPTRQGRLDPEAVYRLRFTGLTPEVSQALLTARREGLLAPDHLLDLAGWTFRVLPDPEEADDPWQAATTYQELSADLLTARAAPARTWTLLLAAPTTFHVAGKHVPFPMPGWVFGSLLNKWNAFAPVTFPPEARRYAEEVVAVTRYQLSTRAVPLKGGALRIGAVGRVTYRALSYDRYWMSVMEVLARFALFAGVGAGAAYGLGQARYEEGGARSAVRRAP